MEALAQTMSAPLKVMETYDRYLAEEAALRLPDVDLHDRARFHRIVRQCALAWSRHPKTSFRIQRSRHALALAFEGPIEQRSLAIYNFRSACEHGEYRFQGLSVTNLPATLSPHAKMALQRLMDLYEAALPNSFRTDGAVTVGIRRVPSIDFLPIVDEARRLLDDGNQEFPPVDIKDLMVVPAEQARHFVGKTTVIPIVRPRVESSPRTAQAQKNPAAAAPVPAGKTAPKSVLKPEVAPPVKAAQPLLKNGSKATAPAAKIVPQPAAKPAQKAAPARPAPTAPPKAVAKPVAKPKPVTAAVKSAPKPAAKPVVKTAPKSLAKPSKKKKR